MLATLQVNGGGISAIASVGDQSDNNYVQLGDQTVPSDSSNPFVSVNPNFEDWDLGGLGTGYVNYQLTQDDSTSSATMQLGIEGFAQSYDPADEGTSPAEVETRIGTSVGDNPGDWMVIDVVGTGDEQDGDPVQVQLSASGSAGGAGDSGVATDYQVQVDPGDGSGEQTLFSDSSPGGDNSQVQDSQDLTFDSAVGDSFQVLMNSDTKGQVSGTDSGGNGDGDLSLSITVTPTPKPDYVAGSLVGNPLTEGVTYSYQLTGSNLPDGQQASLELDWATGPALSDAISTAYETQAASQVGSYGPTLVNTSQLSQRPDNATYLLLVLDPGNTVNEADETNNVTPLSVAPPVQEIYQNQGLWGTSDYPLGSSPTDTIASSGCALTSLVMALDYAGVQTDPITLNNELTGTNGYTGQDTMNWGPATAIATGTADDFTVHWNPVVTSDPEELSDLLTTTGDPVIVRVNNVHPPSPSHPNGYTTPHFVLVTGVNGDTFTINDPAYPNRTTLDSYNNTFCTRGYVSDPTNDLSELYLAVSSDDAGLDITVTDPQGRVTEFSAGNGQSVNQIPNAVGFADGPTEDLSSDDQGDNITEFVYLSQPGTGSYEVQVSGGTGPVELEFTSVAPDGVIQSQQTVTTPNSGGNPLQYQVNLDPAYTVAVSPVNAPPVITPVPAQSVAEGALLTLTVVASGSQSGPGAHLQPRPRAGRRLHRSHHRQLHLDTGRSGGGTDLDHPRNRHRQRRSQPERYDRSHGRRADIAPGREHQPGPCQEEGHQYDQHLLQRTDEPGVGRCSRRLCRRDPEERQGQESERHPVEARRLYGPVPACRQRRYPDPAKANQEPPSVDRPAGGGRDQRTDLGDRRDDPSPVRTPKHRRPVVNLWRVAVWSSSSPHSLLVLLMVPYTEFGEKLSGRWVEAR